MLCPLIEESEKLDLRPARKIFEHLQGEIFPDFRIELLHGRLKSVEKEAVMQRFAGGQTDILVSTTVIEVGMDVANATVMLIEHAERFGLAQLHQLRGRVGRGREPSYCLLMQGSGTIGPEASQRLNCLRETTDGFVIAERDLEIRGPGSFSAPDSPVFPPCGWLTCCTTAPFWKPPGERPQPWWTTSNRRRPWANGPPGSARVGRLATAWWGWGSAHPGRNSPDCRRNSSFSQRSVASMVRVIAGTFKHQRLTTLRGSQTRPTSDKLKETLFNLIREEVEESVFLDCFSGSGSVGIEALSRGARDVTLIESAPRAVQVIERNLKSLSPAPSDRVTLLAQPVQVRFESCSVECASLV